MMTYLIDSNVFFSKELNFEATAKNLLVVRSEGMRPIRRKIRHYSLDVIISIDCRINLKRVVHFHQWSTQTFYKYLVNEHK